MINSSMLVTNKVELVINFTFLVIDNSYPSATRTRIRREDNQAIRLVIVSNITMWIVARNAPRTESPIKTLCFLLRNPYPGISD